MTGDVPVVSVVIAAYNAAPTVVSAIRSALSQTEQDVEVIVVDDGSTDGTSAVLTQLEDPRLHLHAQRNRGPSAARNAGIAVSRGRYVAFLDSDDLWLPEYLGSAIRALQTSANSGFAYTDAYAFNPLTGRVRRRTAMERTRPPTPPPDDPSAFLLELLRRNFIYNAVTVPRAVLASVGGFDEARLAAEDYELWLRIILRGYRAAWVPGQRCLYRVHGGQASLDKEKMYRNVSAVYAGLSLEDMPSETHRKLLQSLRVQSDPELRRVARERAARSALGITLQSLRTIRSRLGLGDTWYKTPPAEVAAAFPDLTAV